MNDLDLIGGHYRPSELLGRGGVARVFLTIDTISGKKVALKMALDNDPAAAQAVISEFRFAMTHRHPALVNPLGLAGDKNQPIIIMPFVEGIPEGKVRDLLNHTPGDPSSARQANLIVELLECAAFIHFCGYLYNDFKPSNFIWISNAAEQEPVKASLLDFNLVSAIGENLSRRGTLQYAAPEVLLGRMPTPASDLYSLGATLFELFTGAPPYISDDSSTLIKLITENGLADFTSIPPQFRNGIKALLTREPDQRPQDAKSAAEAFGLRGQFDELVRSHANYYLAAGKPPYSVELRKACYEYLAGKSEKVFMMLGTGSGICPLDFLSAELGLDGYRVERIRTNDDSQQISTTIEYLFAQSGEGQANKTVLIIDDISKIDSNQYCRLRTLLRHPRAVPILSCVGRWTSCDLPLQIFDLISNYSRQSATGEVLSAYLKRDIEKFDSLAEASGGDPELVFLHLLSAVRMKRYNLLSPDIRHDLPTVKNPEIESALERMLSRLDSPKKEMLSFLAAWDGDIPLIALSDFSAEQMEIVDALLAGFHLRRGKDTLFFPSEDAKDYIYSRIDTQTRQQYHRYWAEASEKFLPQTDGESAAYHWGRSDNLQKGYQANLAVATELFKKSELGRANLFAEMAVSIARLGGSGLPTALMLSADIFKQAGDYPAARRRYLELLRSLQRGSDMDIRAEAFKDLGDLYRSQKKPGRALYYTRLALHLFELLQQKQGVANCHNNIGLILWVNQEYQKALESFGSALAANEQLGNFQELSKIESNLGIIKEIMGKTSEVAGHFEKAYAHAQRAGDSWLESLIANNLGYYHIRHDELDRARVYLQKALEISKKNSYAEGAINALSNLGLCDLKNGDLFSSIDYCQKAMQMAKAVGNKHLSFDAQLFLSEIGILMGNFTLADSVLGELEKDQIYLENSVFAGQVDILRSRWQYSVGNIEIARSLAARTAEYAGTIGDSRLRLEAQLALLTTATPESGSVVALGELFNEASTLGHNDLAYGAALILSDLFLAMNNIEKAETWLDRWLSKSGNGRRNRLEGGQLVGRLKRARRQYDDAIKVLSDIEIEAAANGFLPDALKAAASLAEIYQVCGKISRVQDVIARADSYIQRISSSLPDRAARDSFGSRPFMIRLETLRESAGQKMRV